jgi:hypothetical protein
MAETKPFSLGRAWIPIALAVAALFIVVASSTVQLIADRSAITAVRAGQDSAVQESLRMRQQLESLGGMTAQLAASGNAAARSVVDDFRRQKINLVPPRQ